MPVYKKFDAFTEDKANGVHTLSSDQLTLFLTNTAPVKTNAVLADITEIVYTNLSARALTTASAIQTDGTFNLMVDDLLLTASGGDVASFRWVGVYNDTPTDPADPLICWADAGGEITLVDGQTFNVTFDQVNGLHSET